MTYRDYTGLRMQPTPVPSLTPIEALWCAVLALAVTDYQGSSEDARLVPQDEVAALAWLRSADTCVGSARWICELLAFDYDLLLRRLRIEPQRKAA